MKRAGAAVDNSAMKTNQSVGSGAGSKVWTPRRTVTLGVAGFAAVAFAMMAARVGPQWSNAATFGGGAAGALPDRGFEARFERDGTDGRLLSETGYGAMAAAAQRQPAPERDSAGGRLIGELHTGTYRVWMYGGVDGGAAEARYTVADQAGKVLATGLAKDDVYREFPGLDLEKLLGGTKLMHVGNDGE